MKGNVLWLTEILNTHTHTHTQTQRAFMYDHSSVGKESTCSSGDPGSIPGWGRSPREGVVYPLQYSWASLVTAGKESVCNVGDLGSIPGLERSPGVMAFHGSKIWVSWRIPWTI